MPTLYGIPSWASGINYSKFDMVCDANSAGPAGATWYATQDNIGQNPTGLFIYALTNYTRENDIVTVNFTKTGNAPNFAAGSLISVTGGFNGLGYTGMVINGGAGFVQYINYGNPVATAINFTGTFIQTVLNPAWTTGFFFIPTYSSKIAVENKVINTQLGDLYEQRMPAGLNTVAKNWSMTFQSRGDKETKAISNFVEDAGGVRPFPILIPVTALENQPNQKYKAPSFEVTPDSYGLFTTTVLATRVYDL